MKHLSLRHLVRQRPAFTLLELLVAVALIALLISLVFVALGKVRAAANRTKSLNSLRGMVRGYVAYSTDNNQSLMPGYIEFEELRLLKQKVRLEPGRFLFDWDQTTSCSAGPPFEDSCDASSYVFRLLPYIDHQWEVLYTDYRNAQLIDALDTEYLQEDANGEWDPILGPETANIFGGDIGIGIFPAFGLNSIYLGGDSRHGGNFVTDRNPWRPSYDNEVLAATRLSEVTNPGNVIVFAPTRQANQSYLPANTNISAVEWGYVELRPPYLYDPAAPPGADPWGDSQWEFESTSDSNRVVASITNGDFAQGGGVPVVRAGNTQLPTAQLDGSTSMQDLTVIGPSQAVETHLDAKRSKAEIMSHWWPFSTGVQLQRGGGD